MLIWRRSMQDQKCAQCRCTRHLPCSYAWPCRMAASIGPICADPGNQLSNDARLSCKKNEPSPSQRQASSAVPADSVSERLRRWTRNPLGSARRGSNPLAVDLMCLRLRAVVYTKLTYKSASGCNAWATCGGPPLSLCGARRKFVMRSTTYPTGFARHARAK